MTIADDMDPISCLELCEAVQKDPSILDREE